MTWLWTTLKLNTYVNYPLYVISYNKYWSDQCFVAIFWSIIIWNINGRSGALSQNWFEMKTMPKIGSFWKSLKQNISVWRYVSTYDIGPMWLEWILWDSSFWYYIRHQKWQISENSIYINWGAALTLYCPHADCGPNDHRKDAPPFMIYNVTPESDFQKSF